MIWKKHFNDTQGKLDGKMEQNALSLLREEGTEEKGVDCDLWLGLHWVT